MTPIQDADAPRYASPVDYEAYGEYGPGRGFERGRSFHTQYQGSGGRFLRIGAVRPLHANGLCEGGDLGSDNLLPARHDLERGKALATEGARNGAADQIGKRSWNGFLIHR